MDASLLAPAVPVDALARAVTEIARATTADEVVSIIRSHARQLIGSDGITVVRRENELCHYIEEDAIGPLWKGAAFPESACVTGWCMINRQTVVVPDIMLDSRIPYELYGGTFVRAMAAAPIRMNDPIGAIGVYWSKPHQPSPLQVQILEALANAAADAFQTGSQKPEHALTTDAKPMQTEAEQAEPDTDILRVRAIAAVPVILDVVLQMTGMGFAAVARVTETKWLACQVLDHVGFGLKAGEELPLESTLCNEIRDHRQAVVFDDASCDVQYRDHHTPRIYGLRSYISIPIILSNGSFFGTLCAIDPNPAKINNPQVINTFKLFAELIGHHLDASEKLSVSQQALQKERELAELREQFIAVLGHDLRNPLASLDAGTSRLLREGWTARSPLVLKLMRSSIARMTGLVDNIMDFARSRLGDGIELNLQGGSLADTLAHTIEELKAIHPDRMIDVSMALRRDVIVDHLRIAQLLSNLLSNALTHGAEDKPVKVTAREKGGEIEICVINGGKPIPEEQRAALFQPFRKGRSRSQGLGLGLYIASEIAKAHQGKLTVSSDEKTTCFTFKMLLA